jgi:hypothetical protein
VESLPESSLISVEPLAMVASSFLAQKDKKGVVESRGSESAQKTAERISEFCGCK